MSDPNDLLLQSMKGNPLNILLYGPQLDCNSADEKISGLQSKRKDILGRLVDKGHNVFLAENLNNNEASFLSEELQSKDQMVRRYDIIIGLVGSLDDIEEMSPIVTDQMVVDKSHIYFESGLTGTIAGDKCEEARGKGVVINDYIYPEALRDCHLLGDVCSLIKAIQYMNLSI